MSIVRPGEGSWHSVDNRISVGGMPVDDDGRKQIDLRCSDGAGVLMFTGLATLYPGHTTMADYIRTTLRGDNRTFEGHLTFLRDRLNRDVATRWWRDEELLIHVVAFRGGGGPLRNDPAVIGRPWVYEVANRERAADGSVLPTPNFQFGFKAIEVTEPMWFAGGSGFPLISLDDRSKLNRALTKKPRTNKDYQLLLAAVNRRVGSKPNSGVSPWCQTNFMPPSGIGGESMDHRKPHEPPLSAERAIPLLYWGIDFTEVASVLTQLVRLMQQGRGEGDPVFDALSAAQKGAVHRGIRPRP